MADPAYGNRDRDILQALVALKKGTQLIKYSRKGKPKLCPFRISIDETTLIWLSHKKERAIKLSSVIQIVPRQRTDGDSVSSSHPNGAALQSTLNISRGFSTKFYTRELSGILPRSAVGSDRANMQLRSSNVDGVRLSVSSTPSSSSHGSGPDDIESLGDIYVWGEVWSDGVLDGSTNSLCPRTDVLIPRSLESNVVLDVQQIACGVRHAALVTRQGEVFTWGEESGGQLGHGNDKDVSQPRLVESLVLCNMDNVACGEYHSCAVSTAGDLFTWGDGTHNIGLLGHGTNVSHWIPKKVSGPLKDLQVLSIACGTWHSALTTSNGKVFTFGDGTFGVLGHGDRESVVHPREVESLSGLRTIKVACGLWHTAAIVEVMGQTCENVISRKLFTWGDGDKYRLGHGDKEARLIPTCISSVIDYNFHQLACGHDMTVALTTSGHVFTTGSTLHGQLGNPHSDGKVPCLVQERLVGELVEEISCGAYHVVVLTSRSEVYTWGKGCNGRLGHGDTEDRKTPTLVEALKERHVKSISCGSNFTACICIHKWIFGPDQSLCSGCRQAFGFTRKRHNCYNCGLVHCHACSSKKVLKAALAPTPGKPHRVCDSCFSKFKAAEAGNSLMVSKKNVGPPRQSIDIKEKPDRGEIRPSKFLLSPNADPIKNFEATLIKNDTKVEPLSILKAPQVPSLFQLKDISFTSSLNALQTALKPIVTSAPPQGVNSKPNSKPASPYSRNPSPISSATPLFSKGVIDGLMKTNELLNQEIQKLQFQVKSLSKRCDIQEVVMQNSENKVQQEFAAVEVIKSLNSQLKDIVEKLPPEFSDSLKAIHAQAEAFLKLHGRIRSDVSSLTVDSSSDQLDLTNVGIATHKQRIENARDELELSQTAIEGGAHNSSKFSFAYNKKSNSQYHIDNGLKSPKIFTVKYSNDGETELAEQFEPGVYITFVQGRSGIKMFKRVRFSKKRFAEQQAEEWWNKNKDRVFKKYSYPGQDTATLPTNAPTEEE
ncbi:PH, RCC1 and FYVE domains-containing protein 1 [Canna indica]|uniref:PH, RCC1 and FYVE domains-containing protein 1 n=1 Tax=Canna indica TaxID=4628 RepID=A0AAQ3JSW1_9LILI|nr:PH, RCC1 and FYVE domains-containing protein 1 [Canna indica]